MRWEECPGLLKTDHFLLSIQSIILLAQPAFAQEVTPIGESASPNKFGASVSVNVKGSYFFTSDDDDGEEGEGHALDYQPEVDTHPSN